MELKKCPFCGGDAEVIVRNPEHYGMVGSFVECKECGSRSKVFGISKTVITESGISTPITEETIQRGKMNAVNAWNRRADQAHSKPYYGDGGKEDGLQKAD